ncbi:MAG: rod shape-determining protein MreC [Syntrophus sp. (in: bacteria)]|nr:rod shape-determining protein MreC [Syntrophus sp. (in: bacteria)]
MMFPKKYWTITLASLLILATLAMISYHAVKQDSDTGFFRKLVLEAAWPLESLKNRSIKVLRESWDRYLFLIGLEAENRRLRKEKHLLENQLGRYREGYLDALRLRKMLMLKEQPDTTTVIAEVIDREHSPVFKSILIDKGTAHGLKTGLPVLSDQGIAGRITECSWHLSRIMLIVDVNSNVSAMLQNSRANGMLQGAGVGCRLKYVPKTEEVKIGDVVISSGLGGIFPNGMLLGVVTAVDKKEGDFFQRIDVQPSVDFGKMEEVAVLIPRKDRKP